LRLRSSPEWVLRCWDCLLLVFWCWYVLLLLPCFWVEFLWLLSCGWFVALSSLVGRCCCTVFTVRGWLSLLYLFSFAELIFECIIVSCVIFRVTFVCRYPVCACCLCGASLFCSLLDCVHRPTRELSATNQPQLNNHRNSTRETRQKNRTHQHQNTSNRPPQHRRTQSGEERKRNQGPPSRRTNRQHQKTQRVHKTKVINVEISTSEARNARISA